MNELRELLYEYWILKDRDKEKYYKIRDSISKFRSFISDKLGYQIILTSDLIKLEKLPGKAEPWMGIYAFDDKLEYAFLCLLLMFLEDKEKEEQFLLSQLTEFIQGTFPGDEKIEWTLYSHRRHLIKVLKFAIDIGFIKVNDGDEERFYTDQSTEVLYENTGTSKYFMRNFSGNILKYSTLEDLERDEWLDMDTDRGRIRRNRVYRRIIMSPAVYRHGEDDQDYLYIKNYRNMIQADLEKYLQVDLHVHRNGTFLVLDEEKRYKNSFPENRAISDIVLQVNKIIVNKVRNKELSRNAEDIIIVHKTVFDNIIEEVKEKYSIGWSKEYREMKLEKLSKEVINYMKNFSMLRVDEDNNEIIILPLVGKIVGDYPKDFNNKEKEND
ncbi:TIGR02678 family protein [Caloranaerobacter azorensis DSM 13643]|uniref:TIGR02678 family protein n=1 Tax=Caloranaerobacter azorensis DSM 13643 TaxID=1121264 RepID=A0A1M5W4Z9_9FIRM|nr:TIGR02678 family protein [Caloranaerobacter azorensis]SHH82659.1 TIGR02678 family protein [Caloranaerobacter azorensis DSM 13643]